MNEPTNIILLVAFCTFTATILLFSILPYVLLFMVAKRYEAMFITVIDLTKDVKQITAHFSSAINKLTELAHQGQKKTVSD